MQPRGLAADVLRHHAHLVGGDVQLVALRVLQQQVVPLRPGHGPAHHSHVAAHAVNLVNGQVTWSQLHGQGFGPAAGQARGGPGMAARTEQVLFRDHGQAGLMGHGLIRGPGEPEPLGNIGLDPID